MYADTSKNEDTWYGMLDDCRSRIRYSPESILWAVIMDGISYISDGDPNVLNANRNDEGRWVNANWDKPGNQWNDNGAFAFLVPETLFIFRPADAGPSFF